MLTTTTLLTILTILGAVMFIITVHAIILGIIYTKKKEKEKNTHDKILLDLNNLEHDEFYEELKKLKENKKEENKKEKLNQTKVEEVNNQAMMEGLWFMTNQQIKANTNWKEKEKEKPDLLQNFVDLLQKPKFVDLLKGYATKLKDKFADSVAEYLKDNPNFNPNDLSPSILMQVLKDNPNFFAEVIDLTKNLIKDNPDLFKDFPPDIIKGVSLITITDFFKNFPNPTPPFNPFPQNNGILVSNGEIVDKVTILEIKLSKAEGEKKKLIALELQALNEKYTQILKTEGVDEQTKLLYEVNQTLWKVEDKLRILEKKKLFDELFIRKARSVYKLNDSRAEIKLKINQLTGSILSEVKLYK